MTPTQQTLWSAIQTFSFDPPAVQFTFADRVACENGWSKSYALRVIEEYKRFMFLCCLTETGVTPSDPVDQVWHLHLTYTRSYWVDFCRNTLGREIHHNPTKGGTQEAQKFDHYYTNSHQLYTDTFGQAPPADIWHGNQVRFSDIDFQRVNRRRYWLVPKPTPVSKRQWFGGGMAALSVTSLQAVGLHWIVALFSALIVFLIVYGLTFYTDSQHKRTNSSGDSGCSTSGCSDNSGHGDGHHGGDAGDGGGDSGCSGCSSSGCSGCGGGGD